MTRIYLDNAATSWPKPATVYDAVDHYQRTLGVPAGRGVYRDAVEVERAILEVRQRISRLIGASDHRRIIFTSNGTDSLNMALQGLLERGDHVITSVADHNSMLRPLRTLETRRDVRVTRVGCDPQGFIDVDAIRRAIQPTTRLIALVHASNVTGAVQPLAEIGRLAKEHDIYFLVDAAQSLGHVETNVAELQADMLAAPGHKGLLGPLGTGILYLAPEVESVLQPLRQGGTGTISESDQQPESLPDRYESGNLNVPGIIGLGAGVAYLTERGLTHLREHECQLTQRLIDGLSSVPGLTLYGPLERERRVGVVSFRVGGYDPQEVAAHLDSGFSIQVRAGLHCAPRMHESLGTLEQGGTVRMSVGPFTTAAEIDSAIQAVTEVAAES